MWVTLQWYQITVTAGDIILWGHSYNWGNYNYVTVTETIQLGQCYKWVTLQLYQDTVTTGDIFPLGHSYNWKMLQKGQCSKWVTYRSQLQLGTLQLGHSYNWETLRLGQYMSQLQLATLQLGHKHRWWHYNSANATTGANTIRSMLQMGDITIRSQIQLVTLQKGHSYSWGDYNKVTALFFYSQSPAAVSSSPGS